MLKNKRILLILSIIALLFLIPNISNAAYTNAIETTQTSTGKTVKWRYQLEGEKITDLLCTNKTEVTGKVEIPSTIDGYEVIALGNNNGAYIDNGVFSKCIGLQEIIIPNTVAHIGTAAFYECSGLKNVIIPNSVITIGDRAFQGTILTKIEIPDSVSTIGEYAFSGCSGISTLKIPNSVITMGRGAFKNCIGLNSITISNNLSNLNSEVFAGCKSLTSIIIPESVVTIGGGSYIGTFYNCTKLQKVLIPDTVVTIGEEAFENCNELTIYGNEGQTSKEYAEENRINFNYIDNWDNANAGNDVTPPAINKLEIDYGSAFELDEGTGYYFVSAGTNISIKATFAEKLVGDTAPILTIKCGNGSNIELNEGVIQGEYIMYTYTIKDQDKGIISAVSMTGGDVADEAGNKVEQYTCPVLKSGITARFVYANGKESATTDEGNNNGNNENPTPSTATLSSISIITEPVKLEYTEGESFSKDEMVVLATYSDGTIEIITDYSVSPSEALTTNDTKVVISYTENGVTQTVEQEITVSPKEVEENEDEDTTIKGDNKLPQTGATVLVFALIGLVAIAVVSKVKCGKYKDI